MSIQWTFIAGYLYFEIAVVIIMMFPIISPRRWHQFFSSRLVYAFRSNFGAYFYVLLGVLCLFLFDAVREMRKYSSSHDQSHHLHLSNEMKDSIKRFRAQRNFYITGFAIFLTFVIRRLSTMLIIQHDLMLKADHIVKEAASTVSLAQSTVIPNAIHTEMIKQLDEVKAKLEETQDLLQLERNKANKFKEIANEWRVKYERLCNIQVNAK